MSSTSSPNPGTSSSSSCSEKGGAAAAVAAAAADSSASVSVSSSSSQQAKKRKAVTVNSPTSTAKFADEKKWDRVLANRRSAKESRERRKKLLSDLEESVERLKTENSSLAQENASLRTQLQNALASNNRTAAEATLAGAANPHLARSIAAGHLLRGPGTVAMPSVPTGTTLLAGNALNNQQAMMNTNTPPTGNANVLAALVAASMGAPNNAHSTSSISNSFGSAALPVPAAGLNLSSNALLAQLAALQQNQPQQLNVSALQAPVLAAQQPQQPLARAPSALSGALSLAARTSPPPASLPEEQKQQQ